MPTRSLFGANIIWTMIYDTVYARQDLKDDRKAGVMSMAVRFDGSTKALASILAIAQVGLLVVAGWQARLLLLYSAIACGGSATALMVLIAKVDLKEPASCAWFFQSSFWYVGGSIVMGLFGEYLTRWYDWNFQVVRPLSSITFEVLKP